MYVWMDGCIRCVWSKKNIWLFICICMLTKCFSFSLICWLNVGIRRARFWPLTPQRANSALAASQWAPQLWRSAERAESMSSVATTAQVHLAQAHLAHAYTAAVSQNVFFYWSFFICASSLRLTRNQSLDLLKSKRFSAKRNVSPGSTRFSVIDAQPYFMNTCQQRCSAISPGKWHSHTQHSPQSKKFHYKPLSLLMSYLLLF